jgi:hypothetical protein
MQVHLSACWFQCSRTAPHPPIPRVPGEGGTATVREARAVDSVEKAEGSRTRFAGPGSSLLVHVRYSRCRFYNNSLSSSAQHDGQIYLGQGNSRPCGADRNRGPGGSRQYAPPVSWINGQDRSPKSSRHAELPPGTKIHGISPSGSSYWARTAKIDATDEEGNPTPFFIKVTTRNTAAAVAVSSHSWVY